MEFTQQKLNLSNVVVMRCAVAIPVNSLVCAAEALPLTQGDVGLVHWLDV